MDKMLDKIKSGKGDASDIEDLKNYAMEQGGSTEIQHSKAKFKIQFPVGKVKESTIIQIIDNKEFEIFQLSANLQNEDHPNLGYSMDYIFLPEVKTKEDIDALFNQQRDYLLSATNAELEFEKKIEKNEADGRHLYLTIDASNIKTNYKMYFKHGIFYKLAVVTEEGKLFNKAIGDFFDSFEIFQ